MRVSKAMFILLAILISMVWVLNDVAHAQTANYKEQVRNGYIETRELGTGYLCGVVGGHVYYKDFKDSNDVQMKSATLAQWLEATVNGITVTVHGTGGYAQRTNTGLVLKPYTATGDNVETPIYDKSFTANKFAVCEARILSPLTGTSWFFGFNDDYTEGADDLPREYLQASSTSPSGENVGFLFEAWDTVDAGSKPVYCASTKATTAATIASSGELISAEAEAHMYRVELFDDESAKLYIDNRLVKSVAAAGLTDGTALYPYFGSLARGAGVAEVTVTYLAAWRKK